MARPEGIQAQLHYKASSWVKYTIAGLLTSFGERGTAAATGSNHRPMAEFNSGKCGEAVAIAADRVEILFVSHLVHHMGYCQDKVERPAKDYQEITREPLPVPESIGERNNEGMEYLGIQVLESPRLGQANIESLKESYDNEY